MKVVICSHDGDGYFGGPYEWIKRIALEFQKRNIEVHLLFLSDHEKSRSSTYQFLTRLGFKCDLLKIHSRFGLSTYTENRVRWFLKKTSACKPDIFIANNVFPALLACRWLEDSGIPCVGVYHSSDVHLNWQRDIFCQKESPFKLNSTVFVSQFLKVLHSSSGRFDTVISCGTPRSNFNAKFYDAPRLIYAGKIALEAKQILKLVQAVTGFLQVRKDAIFTIFGDGPDTDKLLYLLRNLDNNQIQYRGKISSDHIQQQFAKHNIFVLLSDYEGMPIALMEAMSVGCVPICLASPSGIPELVHHEVTGLMVKDRGQDFLHHLKEISNDAEKWTKLSMNAKNWIEEHYTTEKVADKWLFLFQRLLATRSTNIDKPPFHSSMLPPVHTLLTNEDVRFPGMVNHGIICMKKIKRKLHYVWSFCTSQF